MSRIKSKLKPVLIAIAAVLMMFPLTGCSSEGGTEAVQETSDENCWVIKIDQTITAPYLGELGDQNEITTENTVRLVATNDNDSPYDGEFTGTAYIRSYADLKNQFGLGDVDYLEIDNSHEAHDFTFTLEKTGVVPLTPVQDERYHYCAKSHFLMPTKGDNPANMLGSAQGYQFSNEEDLDYSVTCDLEQSEQKITLNTDMFGCFEGTMEWTNEVPEISAPAEDK
ncbi:MAG: hypothetical protein VB112_05145 [Oscillospiraceae bacterium]|nr:hypothetical protein [Oscillospiraceae bacterium]